MLDALTIVGILSSVAVFFPLLWFIRRADKKRIQAHFVSKGCRVVESTPQIALVGAGVYKVRYTDREGHEHVTECRTSFIEGCWFAGDSIVRFSEGVENRSRESLLQENARLRVEIEKLQRNQR